MHSSYLLPRLKVAAFLAATGLLAQLGQPSADMLSGYVQSAVSVESTGSESRPSLMFTVRFSLPAFDTPTTRIE